MSKTMKRYFKAEFKAGDTMKVKIQGATENELITAVAAALIEVRDRLQLAEDPQARLRTLSFLDFVVSHGRMPLGVELESNEPVKQLLEFICSAIGGEEDKADEPD